MPAQQESTKKKTLKSSSRLFWFSTGLIIKFHRIALIKTFFRLFRNLKKVVKKFHREFVLASADMAIDNVVLH